MKDKELRLGNFRTDIARTIRGYEEFGFTEEELIIVAKSYLGDWLNEINEQRFGCLSCC